MPLRLVLFACLFGEALSSCCVCSNGIDTGNDLVLFSGLADSGKCSQCCNAFGSMYKSDRAQDGGICKDDTHYDGVCKAVTLLAKSREGAPNNRGGPKDQDGGGPGRLMPQKRTDDADEPKKSARELELERRVQALERQVAACYRATNNRGGPNDRGGPGGRNQSAEQLGVERQGTMEMDMDDGPNDRGGPGGRNQSAEQLGVERQGTMEMDMDDGDPPGEPTEMGSWAFYFDVPEADCENASLFQDPVVIDEWYDDHWVPANFSGIPCVANSQCACRIIYTENSIAGAEVGQPLYTCRVCGAALLELPEEDRGVDGDKSQVTELLVHREKTGQFPGFFGCGHSLPTRGNQCHMMSQDNTVFCKATGSSVYTAPSYGIYGAYTAVDGQLSPGNSGFFHSSLESYPWLKIELVEPDQITPAPQGKDVNRVEIYQRCDANELYHQAAFDIRGTDDPVKTPLYANPRLTGGRVCSTTTQMFFTGGTKFTVPCPTPIVAAKEIWIQKTTLHSHGAGWPNYNGNRWNSWTGNSPAQNSNSPVAFLMINEVVLY